MKEISSSLEDYLEAIYNLTRHNKLARMSDIAIALGVSRPSVTQIVRKLVTMGLVEHELYSDAVLTKKGRKIAKSIALRHELFHEFLSKILGTPDDTAQEEACKLEHAIGPGTTARLTAFVEFVDAAKRPPEWLHLFQKYLEDGSISDVCRSCQEIRMLDESKT